MKASIIEHFSILEDPRLERKKLHALNDIIVLVIGAIVSGADGWEAIEEFGHEKLDWLRQFVVFRNGIPSHDCIAYVISRLSVAGFQECFRNWTPAVTQQTGGQLISIDGKTARGSRDKKNNRHVLHLVSAWANDNRLVLGQEVVEEKSNEIKAIPKILALLELKGCLVTVDARGCQRDTAKQIIEQEGDYVLSLKGNQSSLHEAVKDFFNCAKQNGYAFVKYDYQEEIDKGHGRLETRRYWITEQLNSLPDTSKWLGLRSIGMVERISLVGNQESVERRYFINSIAANANVFAKAVRGHWQVENGLHWRLDVIFREDASRIRKGNAPAILTIARHLCLGLFDADLTPASLAKKRRRSAWSDNYRAKLVFGKTF